MEICLYTYAAVCLSFTIIAQAMHFPWYKNLLSYIWPLRIERKSTAHNRVLDVELYCGTLMLNTKQANYSFGRLHKIMTKVLALYLKSNGKPNSVLLLGYGGGSAAKIIHQVNPNANITAVELDPGVIELAKKWFYTQNVRLFQADAIEFVKQKDSKGFDLIICDVFKDIYVPDGVRSLDFYQNCHQLLSPGGCFVQNLMIPAQEMKKQFDRFSSVFENASKFSMYESNTVFHGFC